MKDFTHILKKFGNTIKIATTLVMARTFGTYDISVYVDGASYARYYWRGKLWAFPTAPIEEEEKPKARINIIQASPETITEMKTFSWEK